MIVSPENMTFDGKKFSMILYGSPGIGKTTLALSAPDPVLIDFDRGMSRVRPQHRKTAIFCDTYEDVLNDLASPDVKQCQTIVVDTGGSFITYLQDWAMRADPKVNCQKNGAISLKGFGAVKMEFSRFTSYVKDTLNKNLIYVFHSLEQMDKDGNPQVRLMCEGAAKNIVWTPCDFGGYVQMIGDRRDVCFTPEQEFFAKGCHGIKGHWTVPELGPTDTNDFITKLFDKAKANIAAEAEEYAPLKEQYDRVMETVHQILDTVKDEETANRALQDIPNLAHALTSKRESSAMLSECAKNIGLVYSKSAGGFVRKEEKEA